MLCQINGKCLVHHERIRLGLVSQLAQLVRYCGTQVSYLPRSRLDQCYPRSLRHLIKLVARRDLIRWHEHLGYTPSLLGQLVQAVAHHLNISNNRQ